MLYLRLSRLAQRAWLLLPAGRCRPGAARGGTHPPFRSLWVWTQGQNLGENLNPDNCKLAWLSGYAFSKVLSTQ
jgi:hypothetical protein